MVQQMSDFLYEVQRFERWAERMDGCTRTLAFGEVIDMDTGEVNPKLVNTFFCHCRHCQLCDGRKSLVRMGRFKDELPKIEAEHPKARWILLTLTVPNPPVNELRATLGRMNKAWTRLIKRKAFKPVLGWIRATEVTQDKNALIMRIRIFIVCCLFRKVCLVRITLNMRNGCSYGATATVTRALRKWT